MCESGSRKGEGLDIGGSVSGTAWIDLATGEVLVGSLQVKADIDLTFGRKQAKAIATLDTSIRRPAPPPMPPQPPK